MNRHVRRAIARRLAASVRGPEARYVQDVKSVLRGLHRGMQAAADSHLVAMSQHKADAWSWKPLDMGLVVTHFVKQIPAKLGPLFDRMARAVSSKNAEATATMYPVSLGAVGVKDAIAAAREANIRLVEEAGRSYADQVRAIFSNPDNFGRRVEDLRDELLARADVSESRAELIARDQTLKLAGAVTQARQTDAGITKYTWSTSSDERVRDSHQELEGQVFSWDSPPEVGHPGSDYQCRCVAVAYIPGIDGPDEED